MLKKLFLFIICVFIFPILLQAWDPASHIYMSQQMEEIWQEFDPVFYDTLTNEDLPSGIKMLYRKFYYIGTTLPDMFEDTVQAVIQRLIDTLYNEKIENAGIIEFKGGADITDVTYNNIQLKIIFNDDPPNQNLTKIRAMVEYARDHNWSFWRKSLIYGCYAHLLEDVTAHMVLQPATFGYGKSIDAPELAEDGLLFTGEIYHELFTPTNMDNWSWVYDYLFRGLGFTGAPTVSPPILQFCDYRDQAGRTQGWQQMNFTAVQAFVDAANATNYNISNLTQERLESYMHGLGIILYVVMGCRTDASDLGTILGHPNWTPSDIKDFLVELTDACTSPSFLPFIPIIPFIGENFVDRGIIAGKLSELFSLFDSGSNNPWPYYFNTVEGWNELWNGKEKTPLFHKFESAIQYYEDHSTEKKPHLRSTYANQLEEGLNFIEFIKGMIDGEYTVWYNLDGGWAVSRKAGLLGGMYDVDNSREYYLQPGIFDMHFESGGNPIYYIENELPSTIELKYKIITFGNTKISINGKKVDGSWDRLVEEEITQAYTYINSSLSLNVQDAVNNGYIELFFEVRTKAKDGSSNYQIMFLSDYEEAFNSTTYISGNQLYKNYFTEYGIPRRAPGQDPIADPTHYWPYSLLLIPEDLVLQNITVGNEETRTYLASNSIQAAGDNTNFIILNGGEATLEAGNYICLKPGFEARTGCTFTSAIDPSLIGAYNTSTIASLARQATFTDNRKSKEDSINNSSEASSEETKEPIPTVFSCSQNSPNPFNVNTTIRYGLPKNSKVSLEIYNLAGQKIRTLVYAQESAGYKSVSWDGRTNSGKEVPQGVYFYTFKAGDFTKNYKMIVVK